MADFDFYITDNTDPMLATAKSDADLNKIVNFADFVSLSNNFDLTGTGWAAGHFNTDADTTFADFGLLSNNFGLTAPSEGQASAVPEPASLVLLSLAIGFAVRRRSQARLAGKFRLD